VKISHHKSYGVIFTFVLLAGDLHHQRAAARAMWVADRESSWIAFVILLFAYFRNLGHGVGPSISSLDIRIKRGRLFHDRSDAVSLLWIITFVFFGPPGVHHPVTPGNSRCARRIGGGETRLRTRGPACSWRSTASDLFPPLDSGLRLGRPDGANVGRAGPAHIELPNVPCSLAARFEQIHET